MPPSLALFLWLILLLGLLFYDPARDSRVSSAVWVPLIWMFLIGSRLPSQWLGGQVGAAAQSLEEGNPLDRSISSVLILLAIGILVTRSFPLADFFARNSVLMAYLLFALMSGFWSDYPIVAFKRWFRDSGNYLMILVVLSDVRPLEAIRVLLRRLCYLLIPLSIVLVKYYPGLGRQYSEWTGAASYVGATTSKNMLGVLCMISGLFFFWDTVIRWSERKDPRAKRTILVNLAFIAMTLWLLNLASSATSSVCLLMGCLVIAAAHLRLVNRHPAVLKVLIPACFAVYLLLTFAFDVSGEMAGAVGRDPTLTGRTDLWRILLEMKTNSLVGTGYESFWLGPRLKWVWEKFAAGIAEAHDGYLEVYLNLGAIGLLLMAGFLVTSYRTIVKRLTSSPSLASLSLAMWTILLFYNVTESALKSHLMWVTFLFGAIVVPQRADDRARRIAGAENAAARTQLPTLLSQPTGLKE